MAITTFDHPAVQLDEHTKEWLIKEQYFMDDAEAGEIIKSTSIRDIHEQIKSQIDRKVKARNMTTLAINVARLYSAVCLSNDAELNVAMKANGFTDEELIWLIPIDKINAEIQKIKENTSWQVEPMGIISMVELYLTFNIYCTVLDKYKIISSEDKIPIDTKRLRVVNENAKRNRLNRQSNGTEIIKTEFDVLMEDVNSMLATASNNTLANNQIYQLLNIVLTRKKDDFLVRIFHENIRGATGMKLKISEKYNAVYNLFSLVLPHRRWPKNEAEFKKSDLGSGKSFQDFRVRTMRKFIEKK